MTVPPYVPPSRRPTGKPEGLPPSYCGCGWTVLIVVMLTIGGVCGLIWFLLWRTFLA